MSTLAVLAILIPFFLWPTVKGRLGRVLLVMCYLAGVGVIAYYAFQLNVPS